MGDVTNIDREDANAKSDIDYMCVYVRVCVCVSHQARRVIFVSDVVSDEGRNNSTRKIHQLF